MRECFFRTITWTKVGTCSFQVKTICFYFQEFFCRSVLLFLFFKARRYFYWQLANITFKVPLYIQMSTHLYVGYMYSTGMCIVRYVTQWDTKNICLFSPFLTLISQLSNGTQLNVDRPNHGIRHINKKKTRSVPFHD